MWEDSIYITGTSVVLNPGFISEMPIFMTNNALIMRRILFFCYSFLNYYFSNNLFVGKLNYS